MTSGFPTVSCSCTCNAVGIVRILMLLSGVLTCVVGVIHVADAIHPWCTDATADVSCVGRYLVWNSGDAGALRDSNKAPLWRSIFSFSPSIFLDLWTPLFFGLISVFLHFPGLRMKSLNNWYRISLFFLITALFANFGYTGNLGIIVGFFTSLVSVLALLTPLFLKPAQTESLYLDIVSSRH